MGGFIVFLFTIWFIGSLIFSFFLSDHVLFAESRFEEPQRVYEIKGIGCRSAEARWAANDKTASQPGLPPNCEMMRDVYEPTTILTQVIKPPGYDQYPEAKAEIARQWARIQVGDPYDYSNWMSSEQREHARDYISSKGTEARILQEMQWHGKILPNLKRIDYDGAPLFIMEEDIHSRANPKYAERPGWFMRRFMGVLIWFSLNGAVIGLLVLVGRRMPHRVAAQRAKAPVDLFDHLVDDDRK